MIPPSFEYLRPKTVPEAVAMLQQHGDEAKILSGGQSLIPMMKLRLARPGVLIDINRISGLSYVKEEGGYLKIGGLTREAEMESSPLVRSKYPILLDTAHVIADPQVRNMATVAGNLAHGDPANDHPATMVALGAQVIATGPRVRELFRSRISSCPYLLRHCSTRKYSRKYAYRYRLRGAVVPTSNWNARSETLRRLLWRLN